MGDRNTEGVEVARSGTKTQFSSDDHRLSILPLSTSIMSSKNVPPSAKLLSFEETNAFFSLFMLGFFFFKEYSNGLSTLRAKCREPWAPRSSDWVPFCKSFCAISCSPSLKEGGLL